MGQGSTVKLIGNSVISFMLEALCEGIVLGRKAGLSIETIVDVIQASGYASPYYAFKGAAIAKRDFEEHFAIDLLVKDQTLMLEQAAALGARCLKISKTLGLGVPTPEDETKLLTVDDPRLEPMWAAAGRLGVPVFIHTGDPAAFFEPMSPSNERWDELSVHPGWSFAEPQYPRLEALMAARDRVVERHRGTTFIGVHFGCWPENLDYIDEALSVHPNLFVDIAARVPEIGRHSAEKLRAVFLRHQDRILFGTDLGVGRSLMLGSTGRTKPTIADAFLFFADHFRFLETNDRGIPHPTPIQGRWTVDAIGLPEDVLEKVYVGNALKLLWHEDGPQGKDRNAVMHGTSVVDFFP